MSITAQYEVLLQAVGRGQTDLIRNTILANKNLLRDDKWVDYTLLVLALQRKQKSIANALLQLGCRVNVIPNDNLHHSPLYYSVGLNDINIVKILLERGVFINAKKVGEETALVVAMKRQQYEIVDLILSKYHFDKIDPHCTDDINHFLIACERDQTDIVKRFIVNGISVNSRTTGISTRCLDYTALHYAIINLNTGLVDFLLSEGADLMAKDGNGWTPLQLANQMQNNLLRIKNHNIPTVDAIIKKILYYQCKVSNTLQDDATALSHFHIACTRDNAIIVNAFLQHGIDINGCISFDQFGTNGFTALHHSVKSNCYEVTELLLNNGADVNAVTKENWTPLMFAVTFELVHIVQLLLSRGADVSIKSSEGLTAIHYAFNASRRIDSLVDLLLLYVPKHINPASPWGLSHFHIACIRGNVSLIEAFIENKVDINARVDFKSSKYSGYSPLHFAVEFTRLNVVDVLIKNRATINVQDMREMTPLHLACLQNYKTLLVLLNEQKIRMSEQGITVWRNSCDDIVQIVKLLLVHNADVNMRDDLKATPLHYAFGTVEMKKTIVKQVILMGSYMPVEKLIMFPLNTSQEKIAEMIINEGADVNSLQIKNRTPLHNACMFTSAYRCLLKADCKINAVDSEGNSPLFLACQTQNLPAIRELLKFGANMNNVNSFDESIFCILHKDDRYNYPIFRVLQMYYIKMLALGIKFQTCLEDSYHHCRKRYVRRNQEDLQYSDSDSDDSDSDYEDGEDFFDYVAEVIFESCKRELKVMKTMKISNFSTLYDVMYKDAVEMAKIAKNENLKKFLISNELEKRFPQYCDFLLIQYRRGTVRDSLMIPAMESLNYLSGVVIPDACAEGIFKNLDNDTLRNLIKSVHTVELQKRRSQILVDDSEPTIKHLCIRDQ